MINKVSIIVPVYNVQDFVFDSIKSVLDQTYKNLEVIIVNDGSTDNSLAMCQNAIEGDSRVQIFSKKNGGLSGARNYGLWRASGDLIYFFDSDDILNKNLIMEAVKYFESKKDIDAVVFGNSTFRNLGQKIEMTPISNNQTNFINSRTSLSMIMQGKLPITTWSFVFNRNTFSENHIFFPEGRLYEDVFVIGDILKKCRLIAILPEKDNNPWYWYRLRSDSIMANTKKNWGFKNALDFFDASTYLFKSVSYVVPEKIRNSWLLDHYLYITTNSYNTLNRDEWQKVKQMIKKSPLQNIRFRNLKQLGKRYILTNRFGIGALKKIKGII